MGLQTRVLIYHSANLVSSINKLTISYNTAYKIKQRQDQYCSQALAGHWKDIGNFPEDLQWEALVDVLRGRVKVSNSDSIFLIECTLFMLKVHTHCYEATDLDGIVRVCQLLHQSAKAYYIFRLHHSSSPTSSNSLSPHFITPMRRILFLTC